MNLRLIFEGPVARLGIDRAAKRNAFTRAMWEAFPGVLAAAVAEPHVRVVVLEAAAPGAFCTGADIGEFAAAAPDDEWRTANAAAIRRAQFELARSAKPVIALIEGDCIGGGCGLALACDMRIATPAARFGVTPAKLGLVYSLHDTKLLVDLVGPGQAKRILFSAGLFDAAEAARMGLVEVVADDARGVVAALCAQIAAVSPHSVGASKSIVRRILDGQADDDAATAALFDDAFAGRDFAEGVAAFLARRSAVFG